MHVTWRSGGSVSRDEKLDNTMHFAWSLHEMKLVALHISECAMKNLLELRVCNIIIL
jgi:hypothetical protein